VVCAPVYTAQDIYDDPWFRERGLLVAHEDEVHGEMSMTGVVPKLTGTPGRIRRAARWTVGADTEDVLGGIGVEDAELATLREDGIV
jgi:crotonobetainyl-CoA:carnitine CoA-transferase CaiB-like acyl-CoA transferase